MPPEYENIVSVDVKAFLLYQFFTAIVKVFSKGIGMLYLVGAGPPQK